MTDYAAFVQHLLDHNPSIVNWSAVEFNDDSVAQVFLEHIRKHGLSKPLVLIASAVCPFTLEDLDTLGSSLDWTQLATNPRFHLTREIVEKYCERLSNIYTRPVELEWIAAVKDRINWNRFLLNPSVNIAEVEKMFPEHFDMNAASARNSREFLDFLLQKTDRELVRVYWDKTTRAVVEHGTVAHVRRFQKFIKWERVVMTDLVDRLMPEDPDIDWPFDLLSNCRPPPAKLVKMFPLKPWNLRNLIQNSYNNYAMIEALMCVPDMTDDNWKTLSKVVQRFDIEHLRKLADKLDWRFVQLIDPEVIEEFASRKLDWEFISYKAFLTPAFVEKFRDSLNMKEMESNPSLTRAIFLLYPSEKWSCSVQRRFSECVSSAEKKINVVASSMILTDEGCRQHWGNM